VARRGRRRRSEFDDEDSGNAISALDILKMVCEQLVKANTKISNLQDSSWIRDEIEKTKTKRDKLEELVAVQKSACITLGLLDEDGNEFPPGRKGDEDQLEIPGVDPRPGPGTAIVRATRVEVLDPRPAPEQSGITAAELDGANPSQRSLPAPSSDCPHERWTAAAAAADGSRQCLDCGLIDVPARVVDEQSEQPPVRDSSVCGLCGDGFNAGDVTMPDDDLAGVRNHVTCVELVAAGKPLPEAEAPPKRKRGRPRKATSATEQPSTTKRGRGRPRKHAKT